MSFAVITCIYQSFYQVINNITQKKNAKNSNFSERKKENEEIEIMVLLIITTASGYMSITIFLQYVKGDNVIIDITMANVYLSEEPSIKHSVFTKYLGCQ